MFGTRSSKYGMVVSTGRLLPRGGVRRTTSLLCLVLVSIFVLGPATAGTADHLRPGLPCFLSSAPLRRPVPSSVLCAKRRTAAAVGNPQDPSTLPSRRRKKGGLRRTLQKRHIHRNKVARSDLFLECDVDSGPGTQPEVSYAYNANLNVLATHPTLVLNADYTPLSHLPLSLWTWREAIKAVFSGRVTVVDVYPDIMVRACKINMPLPAVIALTDYVPKAIKKRPAFNRKHVYLRDEYRCQYCRRQFSSNDLSLDHVLPRSIGGQLTWTNTVTSCHPCNGRKGDTHPDRLGGIGMELTRQPRCPSAHELGAVAFRKARRQVDPAWEPYVQGFSSVGSGVD